MQEWRPRDVRAGIRLRQSRAVWQDGYDWRSGADSASSATCSGPRAVREGFSAFGARRNADLDVGTAVGNALSVGGSSAFIRPSRGRRCRLHLGEAWPDLRAGRLARSTSPARRTSSALGFKGWQGKECVCRRATASGSAASATPRYCRSRVRALAIKGGRRRRGDKDSQLLAVTPDLRDMIETVKDGVARWLQVEDIKHAGGGSGADSAGSVPCSSSSAVREGFSAFGAWRNAASS